LPVLVRVINTVYEQNKNIFNINPLNSELNPICHLLALLGTHHILQVRTKAIGIKKTDGDLWWA